MASDTPFYIFSVIFHANHLKNNYIVIFNLNDTINNGVNIMDLGIKAFIIYMIAISMIAVAVTIIDKKLAIKHKYRIPERTLLIISLLGGSAAMLITMNIIRHKTKHLKFMVGIPIIIIIQISFLVYLINCII